MTGKEAGNKLEFRHVAGEKGQAALERYDPVKIGFLGAEMTGAEKAYRKIHQLAFDQAKEAGRLPRNVEMIAIPEHGLPQGSAENVVRGYRQLVEQGCIAVAGAYSSDNAMVLAPVAAEVKVPLISWAGTDKLLNDWTFRLGNGDKYFRSFRQECRRWGLEIGGLESVEQTTDRMAHHLANLKRSGCDCLVHMGYGMTFVHDLFRPALAEIDWDPPRITTTAFMFYILGFDHFDGWVGIDQYCPENPRAQKFYEAFRSRYGEDPPLWPNAIPLLAYDTATVIAEAMHRATTLDPAGMKEGLERIRFLPTATGGPRTHIAGAPGDHNLFKGDWLLYSKMVDGKLQYEGLFEALE